MKRADKTILYDGSCDFCTVLAGKVRHVSDDFALKDATKAKLPKNITRNEALTEIHLVDNKTGKIYKNIDVVIEYIAQYRLGRLIKLVATLPGIHLLLQFAYKIVANNRHNILGPNSRLFWTKNVIALSFLASVLISWRFWADYTEFPRAPLLDFLLDVPLFNVITFVILIALLLLVIGSKYWRTYVWALVGIFAVLSLADQTALQPWNYQYLVILGLIASLPFSKDNNRTLEAAARIGIAGVYIASAFFKLNPGYFQTSFPWFLEAVPGGSQFSPDAVHALAFLSFVFEALMGFALIARRTRNYGVLAATGMHLFILYTLSPFGQNWNVVVWPWNFGLIVAVWILFWNSKDAILPNVLRHRLVATVSIGVFFVMPVFGHFEKWDASTLSFALYPGSLARAQIVAQDTTNLPPKLVENHGYLWDWSMLETTIPVYPEPRVYKKVFNQLCEKNDSITLYIKSARTHTKRTAPVNYYTCMD